MASRVIYYEIEKHEKYEDSDERADSDLAVVKTQRYHFDDEPFIHPLHNIRFDPDRPYELPVESLLALRRRDPLKKKDPSPLGSPLSPSKIVSPTQCQQEQKGERPLKSWELIPPSKGWMCEGDDVEGKKASAEVPERVGDTKGIEEGGKKEEEVEKDPEEDTPEEKMPAIPRPMDVDADKDYLQYLEELRRHPEYLPVHSSQVFAQHPSNDVQSQSFEAQSQPSFDISGIWSPPVGSS
ncbi:hypothetical protein PIB30_070434 [Stylosanthes scabra]|uniref:Uncharacterized protein n=1 Tax=Stylosanthes scabra TaxID=79078 RepID=A0ABU6SNK0_9FABA|nr:hypothetical protein [Stylosanthes scabra]